MSGKPWATRLAGALCVACAEPARRHAQNDRVSLFCTAACCRRYHKRLYAHRYYGGQAPERRAS